MSFCKWLSIGDGFCARDRGMSSIRLLALDPLQCRPIQSHACCLGLCEFILHQSCWFRGPCFFGVFQSLWLLYLSTSFSTKFPYPWVEELKEASHLGLGVLRSLTLGMSSCGSLYLFSSAAGWCFSDDGWARRWCRGIAECHYESFYCYIPHL